MKTAAEMRDQLIEKAGADDAFRQLLLDDPRGTIESEFDVSIPVSLSLSVHEQSAEHVHIVLPPSPMISESDLAQVSGGFFSGGGGSFTSRINIW